MTLEEALEKPYGVYLAWCLEQMNARSAKDTDLNDLIIHIGPGGIAYLESQWTKRYYHHRAEKLRGKYELAETGGAFLADLINMYDSGRVQFVPDHTPTPGATPYTERYFSQWLQQVRALLAKG